MNKKDKPNPKLGFDHPAFATKGTPLPRLPGSRRFVDNRRSRPSFGNRRVVLVPDPDFLREKQTVHYTGAGTKRLRQEIGADQELRARMSAHTEGQHHEILARRSYPNVMAYALSNPNVVILWRSGEAYDYEEDGFEEEVGTGECRWISAQEDRPYPKLRAQESVVPRQRKLWLTMRILRPEWYLVYETAYHERKYGKRPIQPKRF